MPHVTYLWVCELCKRRLVGAVQLHPYLFQRKCAMCKKERSCGAYKIKKEDNNNG